MPIYADPVPRPVCEMRSGTLCISDLHLDLSSQDGDGGITGFISWLAAIDATELWILGDLFDVWVGPAQASLAGARAVLSALRAKVTGGTPLRVVPGNRDFLLGRDFEAETGAVLYPAGLVGVTPTGTRVLCLHGDELCTRDVGYLRLRRVVRSAPVGFLSRHLPLFIGVAAARRLRRASTEALELKPLEEKSMQSGACLAAAALEQADVVVCGHAHRSRDERLPGGPRWVVLDAFGAGRCELLATESGLETRDWPALAEKSDGSCEYRESDALTRGRGELESEACTTRSRGGAAPMIIAIDGPAAAGKSTVARLLARRLDLAFLDTGAMYRAVTLIALEQGVDPADGDSLSRVAVQLEFGFDGEGKLWIGERPAEPLIRSKEVSALVSQVSAHPAVRRELVKRQRQEADRLGGVVAEGRDTTSVVFPEANHKFFLTAKPEERARRRAIEVGSPDRAPEIQRAIEKRDEYDRSRQDSPLVQAPDAIVIETDDAEPKAVCERMLAFVTRETTKGGSPL